MRSRSGFPALVVTAGLFPLLPLVGSAATDAGVPAVRVHGSVGPALPTAQARGLAAGARQRSIIVLKDQLAGLPASGATARRRITAIGMAQAGLLAELRRAHARHVHAFSIVNAISATISPAVASRLRANPSVRAVVPDAFQRFAPLGGGPGPIFPGAVRPGQAGATGQQICPKDPASPLIEPEARTVLHVPAAQQIADGAGVRVGIIADGLDPDNPDLIRSGGQHVIFDYQDFSGFGTSAPTDGREAFLDAGTIASQGNKTYDLAGFVNPAHPLPAGCTIKIKGIAPAVGLAVLNVAGPNPGFFNSQLVRAIQWAVRRDHVNVLNESFGANPLPDTRNDPVALADKAAVAAGVTVVVSSGDDGPFNNIGSPATAPGVIAVGGTTTYRVYRQTTRYGTQLVPGGWDNDNITALSSSGSNEFGPGTVSVVAPGDRGWSLCSGDLTKFAGCADIDHGANPPPIWAAGGTSASAPETSATAALVIQAYAKAHHGALPSPRLVKLIIVSTATDLGAPADHQGAGLVNALKAVQLASSIGSAHRRGATLLVSKPALTATDNAGHGQTFHLRVTNEAPRAQTVTPSVTGLPTTLSNETGTVTLSSASPTYVDGEGNTDSYALRRFTVPSGAGYLDGDITWNAASSPTGAFETLFDPSGRVAAYSLLGANHSGFGHVEVRHPAAGTWTAVIFTVGNAAVYHGPVRFSYATQEFHRAGSVAPASLTLASGRSGILAVTVPAGQAGDKSLSLHLRAGGHADGSVPIVLRSLVPLAPAGGAFGGTLTGGGQIFNGGQRFTYQFNLPAGKPSLNVDVRPAHPGYDLEGFLVDPNGEPLDVQSTAQISARHHLLGYGRVMSFSLRRPVRGRWTLTLLTFGPVDGAHLREPFTGAVSFTSPKVRASGIPDSARTVLRRGRPVTATVTLTNTAGLRKDFFADARNDGRATLGLAGADVSAVRLPLSLTTQPNWLVPTGTSKLVVHAAGTVPVTMDVTAANGDPDVLGASSQHSSTALVSAPQVAPGLFFALPEATGPFPPAGVGSGAKVDLAATARTHPFDSAVSASSGDVWAQSVRPAARYTPLTLRPGQTGVIRLTFRPDARPGTVVRGYVAVDTFNLATFSGDEIIDLPYAYRVG